MNAGWRCRPDCWEERQPEFGRVSHARETVWTTGVPFTPVLGDRMIFGRRATKDVEPFCAVFGRLSAHIISCSEGGFVYCACLLRVCSPAQAVHRLSVRCWLCVVLRVCLPCIMMFLWVFPPEIYVFCVGCRRWRIPTYSLHSCQVPHSVKVYFRTSERVNLNATRFLRHAH